jgi:hypothetical protein
VLATVKGENRGTHISLVVCEMWDTTVLAHDFFTVKKNNGKTTGFTV